MILNSTVNHRMDKCGGRANEVDRLGSASCVLFIYRSLAHTGQPCLHNDGNSPIRQNTNIAAQHLARRDCAVLVVFWQGNLEADDESSAREVVTGVAALIIVWSETSASPLSNCNSDLYYETTLPSVDIR